MKHTKLQVLLELMCNAKQSDRDLARRVGVSQPTVTRTRRALEKEGYVKEYAMIPDFSKLGFELMAFTFIHLKQELDEDVRKEYREKMGRFVKETPPCTLMIYDGSGMGFERVVVSLHENYSIYMNFLRKMEEYSQAVISKREYFLIPITDDHFQPLTLSFIANYLRARKSN